MLPGRAAPVELLVDRVARSRDGLQVLVIEGAPGIGKTELVDEVVDSAMRAADDGDTRLEVLRASGDADESHVAYGVLDQLRLPGRPATNTASDSTGSLPSPAERGAVLVAWLGDDDAPHRLLVLEDVSWMDRSSLAALSFALRRLERCSIAVLLTTRDASSVPAGVARLASGATGLTVQLDGLDEAGVREAVASWGLRASDRVLERLVRHTGGNPWHLRMVLASAEPAQLLDPSDLPPAATSDAQDLVAAQLDGLSDGATALVQALAVIGSTAPLALVVDTAEPSSPLDAVAQASEAGLLASASAGGVPTLVIDHPTRAAVYHGIPLPRRAELHLRAAERAPAPEVRARHRLAAADRYDLDLARSVAELASEATGRGDREAAAEWELGVARCHPDPSERAAAAVRAAQSLVVSGDFVAADAVLGSLDGAGAPGVSLLRARIAAARGQLDDATELLQSAWVDAAESGPRELGAAAASHLAAIGFVRARGDEAAVWARHALDAGAADLGLSDVDPQSRLQLSLMLAGRLDEALAAAPVPGTGPGSDLGPDGATDPRVDGSFGRAVVLALVGDPERGEADLADVAARARVGGPLSLWAFVQCWRSAFAFRTGRWDDAIEHAAVATIVADREAWSFAAGAHACLAVVLAARGRDADADAALAAAHEAAAAAGAPELVQHTVLAATVWAAFVRGEHRRVLELTEPLVDDPVARVPLLAAPPLALLRGLSAVRSGDADPADAAAVELGPHPPWAAWTGALGALAAGIGGDSDGCCEGLETALDGLDGAPFVLDESMLRLELGGALRRAGRRSAAAEHLRIAASTLGRLGAEPFVARAESELSMLGTRRPRRADAPTALTPTEQVVAALAADGRSNREIAAELVVSVKTVEFHLSNVFRKLGVTNRTQLARRSPG